jgi:hypothetical protein
LIDKNAPGEGERELARLVRGRIDRENDLLAHRTTWVVTSQAFLFTAYALCVANVAHMQTGAATRSVVLLMRLLPWTGMASIVLLYVTLVGALREMRRLRRMLAPRGAVERAVLETDPKARIFGLAAPLGIPAVYLVTWLTLLLSHGSHAA